jgi:diguanylate cyclase (GGDEF)-like protein
VTAHSDPALRDTLLAALHASPVAYALFDPQERLRDANAAFLANFDARLDGAPTWEQLLRACHARRRGVAIATDDIDAWIAQVRRSHRRVPVREFESDLVDGRWMWVTETLQGDGWLLVLMSDVTPLKANEASLRAAHDRALLASLTDPLTGLHNRRHVFSRLDDLLRSTRAMRIPLALALVDLDDFKRINDSRGHAEGDAVLVHFAGLLRTHLRPLDVAGRIGGEEFLLLLPNAAADGALQALARLRSLAAGAAVPGAGTPGYGFSAGLTLVADDDDADHAMRRADQALYAAKSAGRGRDVLRHAAAGG